ncbi:hypothetical protein WJX73_006838 [Symbiochloris irregularis]|uniref:Essential protein Yae1 N-terminal domain-containing protein n=1 Tax=Symbiochloris irregularis TaxID=706552 RepID=A0AAW1Q0Z5_9CHLO
MGELFDSCVDWEETSIREGHSEGLRDGEIAGQLEGRDLGIQKGLELGTEVGYYSGCAQIWRLWQQRNPSALSDRADKALTALEAAIRSFPADPQEAGLQDSLDQMRSKFKTTLAGKISSISASMQLHCLLVLGHDLLVIIMTSKVNHLENAC